MMTFNMARARAASVPGLICSQRWALEANQVSLGSMTMSFDPLFMHSTTQYPIDESALVITGLFPHMTMHLGGTQLGFSKRSGNI